ncbi:MAG: 2-hydroxyacyl-CoA dehydratase subunit D [Smithellaceae bacterium]
MKETLEKFVAVANDPYSSVAKWKTDNNKKIIGVVPMHVPEEIIHAAGMLPIVLWESDEPITLANAFSQPTMCGFPRGVFNDAYKGRLDFVDGMIYTDDCLGERQFAFLCQRNLKLGYEYLLYVPQVLGEQHSKDNLVMQLERIKTGLEAFGGQKITNEALEKSIAIYNKNRALIRKLYEFRRNNPGVLKAREVVAIVAASMRMLKEDHSKLLEKLLADLEALKTKPSVEGKVRVVLSGSLCQVPRIDILDSLEEAGAVVVDDDLYVGIRYAITDVQEGSGDPIGALADRYLKAKLRCPLKSQDSTDWAKQLVEIAKKSNAAGVISLEVKFCEGHYFYYSHIRHTLDAAGFRELALEMEHESTATRSAQNTTRLEAFVESLKGGK